MDWKRFGREIGMYLIAALVIVSVFWTLKRLFGADLPTGNKDAAMLIIGMLVSKLGTIVDYFFGSSKGSADKTEALSKDDGTPQG